MSDLAIKTFSNIINNVHEYCNYGMHFYFEYPLPVDEFLIKIDLPKLFYNVVHYNGVKFTFCTHAYDKFGGYHEMDIEVCRSILFLNDIGKEIKQIFDCLTTQVNEEPCISRMYISFHN